MLNSLVPRVTVKKISVSFFTYTVIKLPVLFELIYGLEPLSDIVRFTQQTIMVVLEYLLQNLVIGANNRLFAGHVLKQLEWRHPLRRFRSILCDHHLFLIWHQENIRGISDLIGLGWRYESIEVYIVQTFPF